MAHSSIAGIGSYVPLDYEMTNHDFVRLLEEFNVPNKTSAEWIVERTGIKTRYIAGPNETNATMGKEALVQALEDSHNWIEEGIGVAELDAILLATNTNKNQHMFPMGAAHLQDLIGANKARGNPRDIPCFDVPAGCTASNYAIHLADMMIRSGDYNTIAVVGSEKLSTTINYADRATCVLFGDMAGAVILKASEERGIVHSKPFTKGDGWKLLGLAKKGDHPEREEYTIPENPSDFLRNFFNILGRRYGEVVPAAYMDMQGKEVFKFATEAIPELILDVFKEIQEHPKYSAREKEEYILKNVDIVVPHQANKRITDFAAMRLAREAGVGKKEMMDRFYINIDRFGNTSAASYLHAFNEAYKAGMVKEGTFGILVGFGAGLTGGANVFKIHADPGFIANPYSMKK